MQAETGEVSGSRLRKREFGGSRRGWGARRPKVITGELVGSTLGLRKLIGSRQVVIKEVQCL